MKEVNDLFVNSKGFLEGNAGGYVVECLSPGEVPRNYITDHEGEPKKNQPSFLILHYTASNTPTHLLQWSIDIMEKREVSWHVTVRRDGSAQQLYSFERECWHTGRSKWKNPDTGDSYENLNQMSIGIEMINWGYLRKENSTGKFYSWSGKEVAQDEVFDAGEPILGHRYWHIFPEEQIHSIRSIAETIRQTYPGIIVLSHHEIRLKGKEDPGPDFDALAHDIYTYPPHYPLSLLKKQLSFHPQ